MVLKLLVPQQTQTSFTKLGLMDKVASPGTPIIIKPVDPAANGSDWVALLTCTV